MRFVPKLFAVCIMCILRLKSPQNKHRERERESRDEDLAGVILHNVATKLLNEWGNKQNKISIE